LVHAVFVRWHRQGRRRFWRWRSRSRGGRPRLAVETRELIRSMSRDNCLRGAERIRGELLKLGIVVSELAIRRSRWRTFLANHRPRIPVADLFTVQTITFQTLYVLLFVAHDRRELVHVSMTSSPTPAWVWC
jgi:hypothetical protein